ncbi:hypothetical protein C8E87_6980 [Paractinoplanes brasiliensis]|uniref:Uncharacterized protein n=2 Tax=Paractinoplanes brasiliensis TaxID=52695 RepID=A0A4R6J7P7_9ACTN|nr:hypothetical protein C8E87_6980 [Actinoplanes brasiliensis]GID30951.1 hypothetical protein Abr02nite_59340 [Actinoplanes brasiliensis]
MHQGEGIGDRHLGALLLVHGMVMNGGPNHAADSCDPAQIAAAASACRYLGLDDLGSLIRELPAASSDSDDEDAENRLSDAYHQLVPGDSTLSGAFEARYASTPEDFDPAIA